MTRSDFVFDNLAAARSARMRSARLCLVLLVSITAGAAFGLAGLFLF